MMRPLALCLALGVVLAAGLAAARRPAPPPSAPPALASGEIPARCRAAPTGPVDPACQAAWRAARERFFGKPSP